MRVYIVQYKLRSTGMICVPSVFDTFTAATLYADQLLKCGDVYAGVQIVSMRVPQYRTEPDGTDFEWCVL